MTSNIHRILRYSAVSPAVYAVSNAIYQRLNHDESTRKAAFCERETTQININPNIPSSDTKNHIENSNSISDEKEEMYHGMFPLRQLYKPTVEYPLWDQNWDGKKPASSGDKNKDYERMRYIRENGVTRHIILIRHGQYDETHKEDEKRLLTPLGRKQAELTGKRIAEMIKGFNQDFGPCNVTTIRVSDLTRAKETADIIAQHLPESVKRATPDPILNEGRPCHHIPAGRMSSKVVQQTDEGHERIEKAFQMYFYRADIYDLVGKDDSDISEKGQMGADDSANRGVEMTPHPLHEFEIIVCHANVIRYFLCRALQIPPEAWLRLCTFNCSLNYITIRPTGSVSCRMLGDIGHLGYENSTFSMHHGFNW